MRDLWSLKRFSLMQPLFLVLAPPFPRKKKTSKDQLTLFPFKQFLSQSRKTPHDFISPKKMSHKSAFYKTRQTTRQSLCFATTRAPFFFTFSFQPTAASLQSFRDFWMESCTTRKNGVVSYYRTTMTYRYFEKYSKTL